MWASTCSGPKIAEAGPTGEVMKSRFELSYEKKAVLPRPNGGGTMCVELQACHKLWVTRRPTKILVAWRGASLNLRGHSVEMTTYGMTCLPTRARLPSGSEVGSQCSEGVAEWADNGEASGDQWGCIVSRAVCGWRRGEKKAGMVHRPIHIFPIAFI